MSLSTVEEVKAAAEKLSEHVKTHGTYSHDCNECERLSKEVVAVCQRR